MTTPRPSAPEKIIHEVRSFRGSDLLDPVHEYIFPDKFYIRNTLVICVFYFGCMFMCNTSPVGFGGSQGNTLGSPLSNAVIQFIRSKMTRLILVRY